MSILDKVFSQHPKDKADLLERIHASWVALEQTIATLDDEELISPDGDSGWAIKDHLAHVSAWDESAAAMLTGRPRHTALGVSEETYREGTDAINRAIYETTKDRLLADVLADMQATHRHALAAIERLSDDELRRAYAEFLPNEPRGDKRTPMLHRVPNSTCAHYDEHREWIEALLNRRNPTIPSPGAS